MLCKAILSKLLNEKDKEQLRRDFNAWFSTKGTYYLLGLMHLFGEYRHKDLNLAIKYLHKSIEKSKGSMSPSAITILGIIYKDGLVDDNGNCIIKKDIKIARIFLAFNADDGDPVAILYLSMLHKQHGKLTLSSKEFEFVAKQLGRIKLPLNINGDSNFIKTLTVEHTFTVLLEDDCIAPLQKKEKFAFKKLERAAQKGFAYDLFNLALAYEFGVGTEVDKGKAYQIYTEAGKVGHELGQQYADRLLSNTNEKTIAQLDSNKQGRTVSDVKEVSLHQHSTKKTPLEIDRPEEGEAIIVEEIKASSSKQKRKFAESGHDVNPTDNPEEKLKSRKLQGSKSSCLNLEDKDFYQVVKKDNENPIVGYKKEWNEILAPKQSKSVPDSKIEDLDISNYLSSLPKDTKDLNRPVSDEKKNNKIKFRTEKYIFNQLRIHYQKKYELADNDIHISPDGCRFSFFKKEYTKKNEDNEKEERQGVMVNVLWPNGKLKDYSKESATPVDLQITKTYKIDSVDVKKVKYCDVKGTESSPNKVSYIKFSKNQIKYANLTGLTIFRVLNAGAERSKDMAYYKIKIPKETAKDYCGYDIDELKILIPPIDNKNKKFK